MTSAVLPSVDDLASLSTSQRAHVLDLLFEQSQPLHTLSVELLKTQSFSTYDDLIAAVGVQLSDLADSLSSSDTQWLESILSSHPRLGAKKVDSSQSQAEQAQLKGSVQEAAQLQTLNDQYESTYPGLRYVVFVDGRDRATIMDDMRQRIATKDIKAERGAAIKAMCQIAADRARKLQQ